MCGITGVVSKLKNKEEQFPLDLQKAFEAGKDMIKNQTPNNRRLFFFKTGKNYLKFFIL